MIKNFEKTDKRKRIIRTWGQFIVILDDYLEKPVVVVIEGGQTIGSEGSAVFLGVEKVGGVEFIRVLHSMVLEKEIGPGVIEDVPVWDDVLIQVRKIKSLHFGLDARGVEKLLMVVQG